MSNREEALQQSWSTINQARVVAGLHKGASLLVALTLMGAVGISVSSPSNSATREIASNQTVATEISPDVDLADAESRAPANKEKLGG